MKKEKPLMKDLQRLVTSNYSSHWKGIGIQLDISLDKLNGIENSVPVDPPSRCNNMLIHWCQSDEEASWNKIIKTIDIVVVSNKNYSCSLSSSPSEVYKTHEAVSDLACRLKEMSKNNRYKADLKDDNWPVATPKHFTSVALIHHKGERTKREVLDIANLQKRGNFDLDKIHTDGEYFKQSKCSKNISDIFAKVKCADGTTKCPGIILIEGVAGIGKTVLSKEIMFQWANGELLSDHTLVFLIPLRDTESQKIDSVKSFINYFGYPQVTEYIVNYIIDSKGRNITIVFDGYDELSEKLRNDSFLYKMMTQNVIQMPFCNVVITSRPNASAHLHDKVDLRVEILGFTNEDREAYIVDALKHDDNKIEKVMTYLNNNPAINAYCYIPLNMTILLSFFESSDTDITELPNTQTGINEKFICTTISRYIRKLNRLELDFSNFSNIRAPCDDHKIGTPCVGHEKGVPYGTIFEEISKLAFKALEKDKIVFTTVELHETCPCLEEQSENWNGLGLLKPVQLFTVQNISRNVSFNFLHFTIQEILAAHHITLMSEADQLKCMKQTFWDNRYYNTWIMYVGLMKNQLPITFKHFLSGSRLLLRTRFLNWWKSGTYCHIKRSIINDKVKCLHLFQCFSEAENNDLCQYVGQVLQENEIDLSGQTLSAVNILTISSFLTRSTTKHWKVLNLSECSIGDDGIKQLHNSFTSNNRSKVWIDTLNLSHNNLTQSSVESIAGLILEWDVKDIMFNEINQNNLYQEVMHQVMQYVIGINNFIACNFNENEVIFARLSQLDYLILSITSTSGKRAHRIENIFTGMQENNNFGLKMIICALNNCTAINYLSLGVNISPLEIVDMAEVIASNNFIEYLYLSKMQYPGKVELKMIIDALKSNRSLQYVDMSLITIDSDLISDIVAVMNNNSKLKEIKVSKLLLRQNDFQHLENYLVKFTGLKTFTITGYNFTGQDVDKLARIVKENYEIWQLNLSGCKVPIVHLLNILSYKSIVENLNWLDLSSCDLHSEEMRQILSVLKEMKYLQHVNLSNNTMTSNAIGEMAAMIKNNEDIQALSLPDGVLDQKDLRIIIQAMQTISTLQYIDFNTKEINNKLAKDIATLFANNSELKQLRFARVVLTHNGLQELKTCLAKLRGVKHLSISDCNHNVALLETFIYMNHRSIQEITITNCKLIDNRVATTVTRDHVGVFDQLGTLDLSNSSSINSCISELLVLLSCSSELKLVALCNCQLPPDVTKQILMVLKYTRHLETVDLSGNDMTDDSVSDIQAMIVNNKQLQKVCLPNCVLNQASLRIICQALQTLSSLQYVDLSTNKIDSELASDVAVSITKNCKLKEFKISKLTLNQIGFQHLNNYIVKIKGLTTINVIGCSFIGQNAAKLVTAIKNNSEIQELNLSNCIMPPNQSWSMLSCITKLKYLNLSQCLLKPNETKEIFGILKWMKCLHHIDLSANNMDIDAINDIAAMIKTNENIQSLSLPNGIIKTKDFKIIFQAMQTVLNSSLEYVGFNNITVDNDLASDVALLFTKNSKLKEFICAKLTLNRIGFQHLNNYLVKIKGLTTINIIGCSFIAQKAVKLMTAINNNSEIQKLNLPNCIMSANQSWSMLSCIPKLKYLNLSHCLLQPNKTKEIFGILKKMNHLQHVDLSANIMGSDAVNDVAAMIKNNQDIQVLSLPHCVLDQKDLMIIIQAMQTSSLEYVDFNNITVDNELASDVALLFTMNSKLKEFRCTKLMLNQIGFQHLNNYLVNIKGLTTINIIGCSFIAQKAVKLVTAIKNNSKIQELNLSNCRMSANQSWSMLSCIPKLKYLNLSHCLLQPNKTKKIFGILKKMKCLQHVDLSANNMRSNAIKDVAAMIKNNKYIQSLSLPIGIINKDDLKIVIQAMQTVSSLQFIDFSTNEIDNDLANDISSLFASSNELELNFCGLTLKHSGFQHLMRDFAKLKGIQHLSITDCMFTNENVVYLKSMIGNNHKIRELLISNCKMNDYKVLMADNIGTYDQLETLELKNISGIHPFTTINSYIHDILVFLSCSSKLRQITLCNCQLQPNVTKQILMFLKYMRHLETVDLSGNDMTDDSVSDMEAMIVNNKQLQKLCLPNCVLNQASLKIICQALQSLSSLRYVDFSTNTIIDSELASVLKQMKNLQHVNLSATIMTDNAISEMAAMIKDNQKMQTLSLPNCVLDQKDFRIIIQAMQTVSSLEYVDFSANKIDNELASDAAVFIAKNSILKEFKFSKLTLNQNGFKHLNNSFRFKGLNMTSCSLIGENAVKLVAAITNNTEIQELNLSNCMMPVNQSWSMLSCITKLKYLNLSNCLLQPNETKEIFGILKWMKCLRHVDLSANNMDSDAVNDVAAMIKNNERIQSLSLPNCIINKEDFKIVIQAMQTVSSLQYVDFSTNEIDNALANDISLLFTSNNKLEEITFCGLTLRQSGFQHLMMHFTKLKGIKYLSILDCMFTNENVICLKNLIGNNRIIRELLISNCKMIGYEVFIADYIGRYDQLENLEFNNIGAIHPFSAINPYIQNILVFLFCSSQLKQITLCNCQLQPDDIKQILMVLKNMRHLETVDLSGNDMTDDSVSDMEAMIVNNKQLWGLCLPNCLLNQASLNIICQALQSLLSLQYVDLSTNKFESKLTSDIAVFITENSKLKELKISKLTNGFQHLYKYLLKIKELTKINIIDCSLIGQNAEKLLTAIINNNSEIQELNLTSCIMHPNQSWSMLSCITKLKYLNLSHCLLPPYETKKIFGILKWMKCLQHVDLSANSMESDAIDDVAAMIKNNEHIQSLSLPNGTINKKDFDTIIQAIQSVSSLQHVDFSTNVIDNDLASDISSLLDSNSKLELNFCGLTLKHSGFQHLMRHFAKLKGIQHLSITDCMFTNENVVYLKNMIGNNLKIRELFISNCKMIDYKVLMGDNIGTYDQLETLELKNISGIHPFTTINSYIHDILVFLSCSSELRQITLCNCQLQPDVTKQILMILKYMRHLETVDLSANNMDSDAVKDVAAMIKNNEHIQSLSLPNGIINKEDFKIVIQAMQTVSSLQYVDFSTNEIENKLASDISSLFATNRKLKELRFRGLTLKQSGFQHLMRHFTKLKGIKCLSILDCTFTDKDVLYLKNMIGNNQKITKMLISNCKMSGYKVIMSDNIGRYDQLEILKLNNISAINPHIHDITVFLSCSSELKQIILCNCQLPPDVTKQILMVLKYMRHLETVDLSGNDMTYDSVSDMEAMIVNNKQLQRLCLPNCVLSQASLKIIYQALQSLSSLQYVDFSTNKLDEDSFLNLKSHHVTIVQESS